jgi:hypothetical protein
VHSQGGYERLDVYHRYDKWYADCVAKPLGKQKKKGGEKVMSGVKTSSANSF